MRLIDADHLIWRATHYENDNIGWSCTCQADDDFVDYVNEEPTKTDKNLLLTLRHDIETIGITVYADDPTIFVPYNEVIRRINKYIDECK